MSTSRPSLAQVAAQLGASVDDPRLAAIYEAAVDSQDKACSTDPYSPGLAEALYRRAAFLWTSKAHTLGVLDTGLDGGALYVPAYHPDWDILEAGHRKIVVA